MCDGDEVVIPTYYLQARAAGVTSSGGNLGVSEWLLTGTTPDGRHLRVRGCDHWEFRDGKVIRKDSYWKIVEKPD